MSARDRFHGGGGVTSVVAGSGVNVDNTNPAHPVISTTGGAALPTDTKTLGVDNGGALVNAWTTVLTSAALATGTWLVSFNAQCAPQGAGVPTSQVVAGTATAVFHGPTVAQTMHDGVANNIPCNLSVTCIVTVTAAGTLLFQTRDPNAAGGAVKASTTSGGFANCTGYTAVKIG